MGRLFEGPGIWVILVVVLLLFGATRLPALARSIGQSTKIFREEMKTETPASAETTTPTPAQPVTPLAPEPAASTVAEDHQAPPTSSAKSGKSAKS